MNVACLLQGEDARKHCIACAERYMADHPEGFVGGRALKEADIGSDLWSAAEVLCPSGLTLLTKPFCSFNGIHKSTKVLWPLDSSARKIVL